MTTEASGEAGADASLPCVDIVDQDDRWRQTEGLLELITAVAEETLRSVGRDPKTHSLAIGLFADDDMQAMNRQFRGKDAPTNVLSFPAADAAAPSHADEDDITFLGDVALSYDTVVREAASEGKSFADHAAHLTVHGVLHLVGFDHDTDAKAEQMESAERAVLAKFGIADPYSPFPMQSN